MDVLRERERNEGCDCDVDVLLVFKTGALMYIFRKCM